MSKGIFCLTRTVGDVVLGNVLVKNIKLQYPDIELDYIVEKKYEDLIKYNPNISNIISIDNTDIEFDNILKLVSSPIYDYIFFSQQTNAIDNSWHQSPHFGKSHLVNFYAKRCNIKIVDYKLELYTDNISVEVDFQNKHPNIWIHTTTLADVKDWDRFGELVFELKNLGFNVYQVGLPSDKLLPDVKLITKPLLDVVKLFKQGECDLFIGLDSGLSYIAAATNIPQICIMGATIPETSAPYGENVTILLSDTLKECREKRNNIRCHGISGGKCEFKTKCINKITVNQVLDKVKSILEKEEIKNE